MNPELNNEEVNEVVKEKHRVFQVTTISKYLAMVLFILLPFLGGWVGYQYALEKIPTETERIVFQNETGIQANWALPKLSPQVMAENNDDQTTFSDNELEFLVMKPSDGNQRTVFVNTNFSLEFLYNSEQFRLANESDKGISVWFWDSDIKNELPFISLDAHHKDFCLWSLCRMETEKIVSLGNYDWEYVGDFTRRDGSETMSSDHVYLYKDNDIILYLRSDLALHDSMSEKAQEVVSNLILDTEPDFIQMLQSQRESEINSAVNDFSVEQKEGQG